MKQKQSLRLPLVMVIAITSMSVSVIGAMPAPAALAQDEAPPAATPIPLATGAAIDMEAPSATDAPLPDLSDTAEATATPEPSATSNTDSPAATGASAGDRIEPDQVTAGEIWTPPSGSSFDIGSNPTVIATVDAPYTFAGSGLYQIYDPVTGYGPQMAIAVTLSNGNRRAQFSVTLNASTIKTGSAIYFQISSSDGSVTTSSSPYNLTRSTTAYLPFINRNSGGSVIPTTIAATGANACDSLLNKKGGPLGPYVNYNVQGTSSESWFYMVNPNPGASIVVSLTNYTSVQGQLQVYAEQAGCSVLSGLLGFGTNPNPIVVIPSVPAGNIYFRVVSSGQPPPTPPAYNISWAYGGGSGVLEPNNNPCQAANFPLTPGRTYTTFSDDPYDFFAMNITGTGQIQVYVQGFTIGLAQVQVRTPLTNALCDPISSTNRVDPFGVVPSGGGDVLITVFISTPGLYYIRLSLPSGVAGNGQPYKITWNYVGGGGGTGPNTNTPLFTTNPNQPANPPYNGDILTNINAGGTATYYWSGLASLGSYDSIQVQVASKSDLIGCGSGDPSQTNPSIFNNNWAYVGTLSPRGSVAIQFNATGGYVIRFRVLSGGTVRFSDEKPLKVNCGTLMTAREFLSAVEDPTFDVSDAKLDEPLMDSPPPEPAPTSEQPNVEPHP